MGIDFVANWDAIDKVRIPRRHGREQDEGPTNCEEHMSQMAPENLLEKTSYAHGELDKLPLSEVPIEMKISTQRLS